MKRILLLVTLVFLLDAVGHVRADIVLLEFPVPPGPHWAIGTSASAIDGNNIVGGYSVHLPNTTLGHGFVYNGGTYTSLDFPGASSTSLVGISGSNIIGTYRDNLDRNHGFLYNGNAFSTLNGSGGYNTIPWIISGNSITGHYNKLVDGSVFGVPFYYNGSTYTDLNVPDAVSTGIATGLDGSRVVGTYTDSTGRRNGYIYNGGTYTTLKAPGATDTFLTGISGNNIIGRCIDANGITHSFVYDGSTYTTMAPPGATNTLLKRISGKNIIGSYTDSGGLSRSFVYDGITYTILDLGLPGSTVLNDIDGNNVVGSYKEYIKGGGRVDRAFLYRIEGTAVPEPSSVVFAGMAVSSLAGYFRWRRQKQPVPA